MNEYGKAARIPGQAVMIGPYQLREFEDVRVMVLPGEVVVEQGREQIVISAKQARDLAEVLR